MKRVTERDLRLVRDIALSHLLSRDQIVELYFGSITRANTRLRYLVSIGLVRQLETPFFGQRLYIVGRAASQVVGERIGKLIEHRSRSPRFVRHALSTTNARIALTRKGAEWRFEQQLWRKLNLGRTLEIRPDGMVVASVPIFVEVDMGHVSPAKFKEKLLGYQALARDNHCLELYGSPSFRLLIVTTGHLRARRLRSLLPDAGFDLLCQTFEEVGARPVPNWS